MKIKYKPGTHPNSRKNSPFVKGHKIRNTGKTRFKKGESSTFKGKTFKHTEEQKQKMRLRRGEKSGNWQGGKMKENRIIRGRIEFREWRTKVFERDNYTCQICGVRGCYLHPHHLKQLAKYPELAFKVDNGQTLCVPCHLQSGLHRG